MVITNEKNYKNWLKKAGIEEIMTVLKIYAHVDYQTLTQIENFNKFKKNNKYDFTHFSNSDDVFYISELEVISMSLDDLRHEAEILFRDIIDNAGGKIIIEDF